MEETVESEKKTSRYKQKQDRRAYLADLIIEKRALVGWSQDDLALKSGISKSAISDIENSINEDMRNGDTIGKLLEAIVDVLCSKIEELRPKDQAPIDNEKNEMDKYFPQLNYSRKITIIRLVKDLTMEG